MDGVRDPRVKASRGAQHPGVISLKEIEVLEKTGTPPEIAVALKRTPDRKPLSEQPIHRQAYAFYLSLKGKRSYAAVVREFGIQRRQVIIWSKKFHWKQRCDQADTKVEQQLLLDSESILRLSKQKLIETAVMLVNRAHEVVSSIKFESPQDIRAATDNYFRAVGTADISAINAALFKLGEDAKELEQNTPLPPVNRETGEEIR